MREREREWEADWVWNISPQLRVNTERAASSGARRFALTARALFLPRAARCEILFSVLLAAVIICIVGEDKENKSAWMCPPGQLDSVSSSRIGYTHMRAPCQLVMTTLFVWNNFALNSSSATERDCQRARRLTRLPCLRLLLARLLRQAQLSDTARNFPSFSSTM